MLSTRVALGLAVLLAACNEAPLHQLPLTPMDWPSSDAGEGDAAVDAGPTDAGAEQPMPDAGTPEVDAGLPEPIDAGIPNAQTPELPCTDLPASVYLTPAGPLPTSDAARGDRVRCSLERLLSASDVQAKIAAATSGANQYLVSYWTQRSTGAWAISSARVWLPLTPKSYPLPVIVVDHPSVGVADSCAPSHDEDGTQDLALPWAARGYAVIAPDYAGLGTDGIQSYVDGRDTAQSVLDAARALRKLLTPATFDQRVAILGYSQGGGAALAAQGIERTYGSGGKLVAVAALAPQWASRLDSFGTLSALRTPTALTISTGYTKPVISVLRQYGYFANHFGLTHAGDGFPASGRAAMTQALDTMCLVPLGGWLQGTHFTLGGLVDDTLRTTTLACLDTPGSPACQEPGKSYLQFLKDNLIAPDPQGAPVLYVQGLLDTVMPPLEEAACNVPKLQQAGVDLQLCTDSGADHTNLVDRDYDLARLWAEAKLWGTPLPTCTASQLAPCPP